MKIEGKRIHFIGICGISLSALAVMCKAMGAEVSGSDLAEGNKAKELRQLGIAVFIGHSKQNVKNSEIVVYSSAVSEDNVELRYAKEHKLKVLKRATLLGEISKQYETTIAVSGCHGKTTTTAMIGKMLVDFNLDPTIHIGGEFSFIGGNVRVGGKRFFVTEACEYKNNFLKLRPDISVVLNVEPDHLDFFKTFENVKLGFYKFLSKTKHTIVINADCEHIVIPQDRKVINFSLNNIGFVNAVNLELNLDGTYSFDYILDGAIRGRIKLAVCGKHNIYNALACIVVGEVLKIPPSNYIKSLESFKGVDRRFQLMGTINKTNFIIDYAHHPTEIESSIKTAKTFTKGEVIAIFQPHTFSRTQSLFCEFISSLMLADKSAFYKIYPAREEPIEGITHFSLAQKAKTMGAKSIAISDYDELVNFIYSNAKIGNTILLLGAGDYVDVCNKLKFD